MNMNADKPLVSVIVAVYNIEKYIAKCLDSIIGQTYENLQIIVVDDGSKDNSGKICDEYSRKDSRIQVIHKQNGGLSDARNAGLKVATGEYIGYVDGDDWIEPSMYEKMMAGALEYDAQLICCRYKNVFRDRVTDGSSGDVVRLTPSELLDIYVNGHPQYVIYNSVWSKLYKREIVQDLEFPVGHNSEDIMYSTTAMCRMTTGVYVDTALYNYVNDRDDSIMNDVSGKRMLQDEIPFWRRHIEIIREYGYEDMSRQAAYRFYRRLLFYYTVLIKSKANREYAKMLVDEIKKDKETINSIYAESFVKDGDLRRMKLFLQCPYAYYITDMMYNKLVIPVRLAARKIKR